MLSGVEEKDGDSTVRNVLKLTRKECIHQYELPRHLDMERMAQTRTLHALYTKNKISLAKYVSCVRPLTRTSLFI